MTNELTPSYDMPFTYKNIGQLTLNDIHQVYCHHILHTETVYELTGCTTNTVHFLILQEESID